MGTENISAQPLVSVIVPTYNVEDTIDSCLQALAHQTVPRESYEIVVVDDGSSDGTCTRIEAHGGVHLYTQAHAGPAAARNCGVKHAQGKIVLFTDADCEPAHDWIERMMAPFDNAEIVGAKGAYLSRQRELVARFVQMEYEDRYDVMLRRVAQQPAIDFVDTYAAGYRRDVFEENGGFDTAFPLASVEDQELSFRLAQRGYRMVFVPAARVYHWGHPQNLQAYWRRKFNIGYWKVLVLRRHPDKLWRDSHTPQILKAQILLVGIVGICLLGSILWPPLAWGLLLSGFLYLISTLPFAFKAWAKDRSVAIVSPGLLFVRALALGTGFVTGLATDRAPKSQLARTEITDEQIASGDLARASSPPKMLSGPRAFMKRAMDIGGALVAILLFAPLMLLTATLVKLGSEGPVLFMQLRAGVNGKVFKIYKFRTMVANAEELLDQLIDLDGLEEPMFKLKDDPRVTPLGRFLRRWSIDELPQLYNVLKGEMSLVGPRPEEARLVQRYNHWHRLRLLAKPGMTGPVQINGRGDLPLEDRVQLEVDYIHNYSIWKDIEIILKTVPVIVRGDGSY